MGRYIHYKGKRNVGLNIEKYMYIELRHLITLAFYHFLDIHIRRTVMLHGNFNFE